MQFVDNGKKTIKVKNIIKATSKMGKVALAEAIIEQIDCPKLTIRDFLFDDSPDDKDCFENIVVDNNGTLYEKIQYIAIVIEDLQISITSDFAHFFMFIVTTSSEMENALLLLSTLIRAPVDPTKQVQINGYYTDDTKGVIKITDINKVSKVQYVTFARLRGSMRSYGTFYDSKYINETTITMPLLFFNKCFQGINPTHDTFYI